MPNYTRTELNQIFSSYDFHYLWRGSLTGTTVSVDNHKTQWRLSSRKSLKNAPAQKVGCFDAQHSGKTDLTIS